MNVKICVILAITIILLIVVCINNKVREGFFQGHYYEKLISGLADGYNKRQCMGMDKDDKKIFCVTNTKTNNPSIINPSIIPKSCIWDNNEGLDQWRETSSSSLFCDNLSNKWPINSFKDKAFNPLKLQKSERMHVVDVCRTNNQRWEKPICSKVDVQSLKNISVSKIKKKGFHLIDLTGEQDQSYDKLKEIVEERGYVLPTADDLERFIALEDTNGITGDTERGYPITWPKSRDGVANPIFSGKDVWMPTSDGDWIQGGNTPHPPGTSHIKDLKVKPVWHNLDKWNSAAYKGYILAFDKNSDEIKKQDDANIQQVRDLKNETSLNYLTNDTKITNAKNKLAEIKNFIFKSKNKKIYNDEKIRTIPDINNNIQNAEAEQKRLADEAAAEAERQRLAHEAEQKRLADEAAAEAERQRLAHEAEQKRLADEAAAEAERQRLAHEAEQKRLADEAAAKAAAEEAEKTRLKNSIQGIQQQINGLKTAIDKFVSDANIEKNELDTAFEKANINQINSLITRPESSIDEDISTINRSQNNIKNILNNINLPSENANLQSLKTIQQQIETQKINANNDKDDAETALTNIRNIVRDYKNEVDRKIEEIRIEKERIEQLEREREELIRVNEESKERLKQLNSEKALLEGKINIEGDTNQTLNDELNNLNSEIEIVNKEIKDIDEKIRNFSFAKIGSKINESITLVNNYLDDLHPDTGNVITGFTNMNQGFVYNKFSNNHKEHQRNIYTIPISDEYD